MSRFFKSAAFPILIVVVLAFFAQKLISPGHERAADARFGDFITQLDSGQVKTVDLKTKDNTRRGHAAATARSTRSAIADDYGDAARPTQLAAAKAEQDPATSTSRARKSNGWLSLLTYVLPFLIFIGFWIFLMNQVQGGGSKVMSFGKSRAKRMSRRLAEDHLPRRRGRRRGGRGAPRDQGVPREPEEVPGARRADPQGRAALRAAGHRQDAARPRGRRRGGRAVLLDLRLGLRRDVRRRRRLAACATSSSRPSRTRPASSSWTRSTPSAATAAPASAAATTSASRRSTSCSSRWTASR